MNLFAFREVFLCTAKMKTLKNVSIFTEPEDLSVLDLNNRAKQIQVRLKA